MQPTETKLGEIRQKRSFIGRIMVNSKNNWEGSRTNLRKWAEAVEVRFARITSKEMPQKEPDLQD